MTDSVTGIETAFYYDADTVLTKKVITNGSIVTTTIYAGGLYEVERVGTGTPKVTRYTMLGGKRVAMRVSGSSVPAENVTTYLHGDHLGSASLATSDTGTVISAMRYTPYGAPRDGSLPTDRRYTGQREEAGIGLYDYNARFYDPALGRFISADTIVPGAGDPQAFNRYAYVSNNPVKRVDPSGHCWGPASGVRDLPGYGVNCANVDMALQIALNPDATVGQRVLAVGYLEVMGGAHLLAVEGLALALAGATGVLGTAAAAETVAATTEVAGGGAIVCGDGDCTNEGRAAVQAVQTVANAAPNVAQTLQRAIWQPIQSIWNLSPFARGAAAEQAVGGRTLGMPFNFPVIDRFVNGVATSYKEYRLVCKKLSKYSPPDTCGRRIHL